MLGNLLRLRVRAVRLLMVCQTRLSDHVGQLLRCILLECLRCDVLDPSLVYCSNQFRSATCDERVERAGAADFSDRVPLCFLTDARQRSNLLVCLLSCPFLPQSSHSAELRRGTVATLNDKLHSSVLAVLRSSFEELGVRKWSPAVTLFSSNVCWRVVATLVHASGKTDSVRSQFQLSQPLLGGEVLADV